MLSTRHQLTLAKTDRNKDYYENKCAGIDRQIDELAFSLYGLNQKDVEIVKRELVALEGRNDLVEVEEEEDE